MARKNNSQNQFSRFLGFAVGLAKNMAHSPEGVSREEMIKNVYEAQGGIFKCQVTLDTTLNIVGRSVCNPFGLSIDTPVGSTGEYSIVLSNIPSWLSSLGAFIGVSPSAPFNLKYQILSDTGECPYIIAGDVSRSGDNLNILLYIFDVDGTTPKDLDATTRICVDLSSVS